MKAQPTIVKGEQPIKRDIDIAEVLSEICDVEPPKNTNPDELLAWFTRAFETCSDKQIIEQYELGLWQSERENDFGRAAKTAFLDRCQKITGGYKNAND